MSTSDAPESQADPGPHSPCSGVCMLDQRFRWCAGCFRTPAEIGEWPAATAERKHEILAELDERELRSDSDAPSA